MSPGGGNVYGVRSGDPKGAWAAAMEAGGPPADRLAIADRTGQRVRLAVMGVSLLTLSVITLYQCVYFAKGAAPLALLLLPCSLAAAAAFVLGRGGRVRLARHLLLAVSNLYIFVFAEYFGPGARVELLFLVSVVLTVLLVSLREGVDLVLALGQPVLYLAILSLQPRMALPMPTFDESVAGFVRAMATWLTVILVTAAAITIAFVIHRSEQAASRATVRLALELRLSRLQRELAALTAAAASQEEVREVAGALIASEFGWEYLPAFDARLAGAEDPSGPFVGEQGDRIWMRPRGSQDPLVWRRRQPGAGPADQTQVEFLSAVSGLLAAEGRRLVAEQGVAEREARLVAAARMASLGEMAGGIAHEINNPLAVIQAYLARIRRYLDEPEGRAKIIETIRSINDTLYRINRIVTGLKGFARGGQTGLPVEAVPVDSIVEATMSLAAERFRAGRVELEVRNLAAGARVECRQTEIEQVLVNLLNNAIDAVGEEAAPWVCLTAEVAGDRLLIRVKDNGPGVDQEHLPRLMQPFFTTKPPGKGTGLGLSISRSLVQSLGGSLSYQREGRESVFTVDLPLVQSARA